MNCKLQNPAGQETQTIHVNQLKPFHPQSSHLSQKTNPIPAPQVKAGTSLPTCDIFDLLDHEPDTLPEALPQNPLIARNWCQVDATNISFCLEVLAPILSHKLSGRGNGVIGTYFPPGPCTMGLLTSQGRPGFFVGSLFMPMGTVCFVAVD